jgi:hypothetical protein
MAGTEHFCEVLGHFLKLRRATAVLFQIESSDESWISDLDDSVFKYTETDGDGEPTCPSSCSTRRQHDVK